MENGEIVAEEDAVTCPTEPQSPVQGDSSDTPSDTQATPQATPPTKENAKKKKQTPQQALLAELVEEQRQLRLSLERTKDKELQLRQQQLQLDKAAGEREERLISILEKLIQK